MSATYSQMAQKKIGIFSLFLKFLCKFEFLWYLQKKNLQVPIFRDYSPPTKDQLTTGRPQSASSVNTFPQAFRVSHRRLTGPPKIIRL